MVCLGDAAELIGAVSSSVHATLLLELTQSLLNCGLEHVASWSWLLAELQLVSLEVGQRWLMFVRLGLDLAVAAFCSLPL